MNWFPQLSTGATTQYPLQKTIRLRNLSNDMESGQRLFYADPDASYVQWHFSLVDLSASELQAIQTLHALSKGRCGSFGFVDPLANLLGATSDFIGPEWQAGQLQIASGIVDPFGVATAWKLTNNTDAEQIFQQTISIPGSITGCFSVFVRSEMPDMLTIHRDSAVETVASMPEWKRVHKGGQGDLALTQSTFGIAIGPHKSVYVWGPQVEAQPCPSIYKSSVLQHGVYPRTNFFNDRLSTRATGPSTNSCEIDLISLL